MCSGMFKASQLNKAFGALCIVPVPSVCRNRTIVVLSLLYYTVWSLAPIVILLFSYSSFIFYEILNINDDSDRKHLSVSTVRKDLKRAANILH